MTLEDTVDTFSYYVKQLASLNIAYVALVQYLAGFDPEFDGNCPMIDCPHAIYLFLG